MVFTSINPATGNQSKEIEPWGAEQLERALKQTAEATPHWAATDILERANLLRRAGILLRERRDDYARLITLEMGKLFAESQAEIEKCAWGCEHYVNQGPPFIADEIVITEAKKSYVAYRPLGALLALMPWNFPFWQVFRCAAPTLLAGNTAVLKHASNVPRCALAIEELFADAGFPQGVFTTLMITAETVPALIADPRIHAVSLTGSESVGRKVAALAGHHLKKHVLELGGSDPFIVLADADLDYTVSHALASRFSNAGQSCIAAKRFIVVDAIADQFVALFKSAVEKLKPGDPFDPGTTLAPLAREDLRDELHHKVTQSIQQGEINVSGCTPIDGPGFFYAASILDNIRDGMPAYNDELFGPVAAIIRVRDAHEALRIANASRYGLGASVWTQNIAHGEAFARQLEAGLCFVNAIVKSNPNLPFGGVKASGYGREPSHYGMREFMNVKTVWVDNI